MWDNGDITEHRRGFEGKVDVYCRDASDAASGGFCYAEHLGVLDVNLMTGATERAVDLPSDDECEESAEGASSIQITSHHNRAGTLGELLSTVLC